DECGWTRGFARAGAGRPGAARAVDRTGPRASRAVHLARRRGASTRHLSPGCVGMRIGINALFLQKPTTGMGQHLLHLLEGLDSLEEREQQYTLLAPRFRRAYTVRAPQLSDRFREVEVVSALARLGENVEQVWWEQVGIVLAGMREKIDLLHCPYWSNPLWSPWPTVVTVHDVIQFVLPEYAWRKISR